MGRRLWDYRCLWKELSKNGRTLALGTRRPPVLWEYQCGNSISYYGQLIRVLVLAHRSTKSFEPGAFPNRLRILHFESFSADCKTHFGLST